MTRKHKFLAGTVSLLLSLLLLCACAARQTQELPQETEPTVRQTEAETEPAQTAQRFGLSYLQDYSFNPYTCTSLVNRAAFSLLFEPLFSLSTDFQPEPVLCDRFTVSEDAMTYRIQLVSGATFSDGTPLSAQDVAASYRAAQKSSLYGGQLSHIRSVAADGDGIVVFLLDTAYENLPLVLDVPILKADSVDAELPIGTGPYALSEADGKHSLRRVQNWWQDTVPPVEFDEISLNPASSAGDIRDAFEFGGTDLVLADPNSAAAVGYQCDYELWNCPTTVMLYLGFNQNGAFASKTLRAAMTYGVDRGEIAMKCYSGFAAAASLPCSPDSAFYDDDLADKYAYDPERFASMAADSGARFTKEQPGVFVVPSSDTTRVAAAQSIADAMASHGVILKVTPLDSESYGKAIRSGEYDLYLGEARLTANFDLSDFFRAGSGLCYGGIASSAMETMCLSALQNSGNYYDLHAAVMEQAPICPILFKSYAVYATRGTIGTLHPSVDSVFHRNGTRSLSDANVTDMQTPTPEETQESIHTP